MPMTRMFPHGTLTLCGLVLLCLPAASQNRDAGAAYQQASSRSGGERIQRLEEFLTAHPNAVQRSDAQALLAWSYEENGNSASAASVARQLLAEDENNVIALALMADNRRHDNRKKQDDAHEVQHLAERGLAAYKSFRAPGGITPLEAYRIQRRALAMLEGARGFAAWRQKDYVTAQTYLRQATQVDPGNAEDVYELALVDLDARPPNATEGYQMLARAAKLAGSTPQGAEIAAFGRQRYTQAGGSSQDWDRYLNAAGMPSAPAQVASARRSENITPVNPPPQQTEVKSETRKRERESARTSKPDSRKEKRSKDEKEAKLKFPDDLGAPKEEPAPPRRTPPRPANGAPVSLGIVIEASQLQRGKQDALVDGLSDVLSYLRPGDEAFILAFGKDLEFTQDLTNSPRVLEEALAKMKPEGGTALYEAIGVAAGHLKRIAKNPNRVLLVISDGQNTADQNATFTLESNLDEVRVFCLGVGVGSVEDQRLLQALAQRTGGSAHFVADVSQFSYASDLLVRSIYGGT